MADADLTLRLFAELRERLDKMDHDMKRRFDDVDRRFDTAASETNRRFDDVDRRLDNTNAYLVAQNARLSTEISAVRGTYDMLEPKQGQLEDRVEQCEQSIDELKNK